MRATETWWLSLVGLSGLVIASAAMAQGAPAKPPAPPPAASGSAAIAPSAAPAQPPPAVAPAVVPPGQPPAAVQPAPGAPPPGAAPAAEDPEVLIHIDSPRPVRLVRRHGANTDWWHVCMSPCDVKAPIGDSYVITGDGVQNSPPFRLGPPENGRVTLHVKPGSPSKHTAGIALLGGGGVLFLTGVIVMAVAGDSDKTFQSSASTHNEHLAAMSIGSFFILAGLATGITGGSWMYEHRRSHIESGGETTVRNPEPAPAPQTGPVPPSAMRAPAWYLPVLTGRF